MDREKFTRQVNVAFSDDQYNEIHAIIQESAPGMSVGALVRLAWLYFLKVIREKGLIHVMAEILGA